MMFLQGSLLLALAVCVSAFSDGLPVDTEGELESSRLAGATDAASFFIATVNILKGQSADTATHICQGVIIAPNMTLTAASCLYDITTLKMVLDMPDPKDKLYLKAGKKLNSETSNPIEVIKIIVNPGFRYYPNAKQFGSDLALLIPAASFAIDNLTIAAVPLSKNSKKDENLADPAHIASWGSVTSGSPDYTPIPGPDKLQFVTMAYKKTDDCTKGFEKAEKPFELQSTSICLQSAASMSFCKGDAGAGVFTLAKSGSPFLVGVASDQVTGKCPLQNPFAQVVTRVTPFLTWINKNGGPKP